jgi:hypothetical protein
MFLSENRFLSQSILPMPRFAGNFTLSQIRFLWVRQSTIALGTKHVFTNSWGACRRTHHQVTGQNEDDDHANIEISVCHWVARIKMEWAGGAVRVRERAWQQTGQLQAPPRL